MKLRKCDTQGCGHYGASRGTRKHNGVDVLREPGITLYSPVAGVVTKLGYTYSDDLSFRYVEVTSAGYRFRFFYVYPAVELGDSIKAGALIGTTQDLTARYAGIGNHFHLEIKSPDGAFVDPTPVALCMGAA